MAAKILIVDDQRDLRVMIIRLLRRGGYDLHEAEDGNDGLQKTLDLGPDLVLLDMHMPGMNGYEAARSMRANGYGGIIVAFTASARTSDSNNAITAGCDYFLSKPIVGDFTRRIAKFLEEGRPPVKELRTEVFSLPDVAEETARAVVTATAADDFGLAAAKGDALSMRSRRVGEEEISALAERIAAAARARDVGALLESARRLAAEADSLRRRNIEANGRIP
ncbi:MAG: response regulator [Nitrospinae bacterium]|nr:response regulator [Nitrospinota bacterium]